MDAIRPCAHASRARTRMEGRGAQGSTSAVDNLPQPVNRHRQECTGPDLWGVHGRAAFSIDSSTMPIDGDSPNVSSISQ